MMTKDEALIEEAMDVANEIDVAIAFKREWEAIDIIPSLLRKLAEALKQAPLNLNCKSVQKRLANKYNAFVFILHTLNDSIIRFRCIW